MIDPTLSNHIILSTNPVSKGNWCYKYFFQDKKKKVFVLDDEKLYKERTVVVGNTYYHHSTVDDNFFVPKEYVEQLDDLQTHDPDLYRVARQGRFGVNGSLVFPQFVVEPANQVEKEIKAIRTPLEKNGMDFGFVTSYNAALRMIVDHDEKILYIYREYYSRNKTDPEIAEDMKDWKDIVIKADCAEPKAIRYYKQSGFRMKACKKFKGSRAMYTKKVKRFKKIVCSDACPNTIDELQDLTFAVDKDDEIIEDEFNIDPHTLSAIWYALDDYEVYGLIENGLLSKSVISDYNKLQNLAKGYGKSIEEMLYSRYPKAFRKDTEKLALKEEYRGISDILNGMSSGEINLGYWHDKEYWKKTGRVEAESFAQFGRALYGGNPEVLDMFKSLFPNSYDEVSGRIERLIK